MLMAQNNRGSMHAAYEGPNQGFDLQQYLSILRRRWAFLFIPFVLVLAGGIVVVALKQPIYLAEGKILVESQQIPTDLVRPTITATANERIQVIEQRIMIRDNLMAIADKFQMFPDQREHLSATQILDMMRERTHVSTYALNNNRRGDGLTIALTIGFEYEQPQTAMMVANELITLILAEDARNRASRAQETTNFLAQEVKRLEGNLGAIDAQIAEFKRTHNTETNPQKTSLQLALVMAELQEKSAVFSSTHPEVIRLQRQLDALEKAAAQTAQVETGLETLQNQRAAFQRQLDSAAEKLSTAKLGENLERAQFSERLEVLEQAILPQKPFKPNRKKMLGFVLGLALAAGIGCILLAEMLDNSIKAARDVYAIAAPSLVQGIPYIATKQELLRQRWMLVGGAAALVATFIATLMVVHFFVRPLDQLLASLIGRLLG
jgi:protein tyrosine kinase modulator